MADDPPIGGSSLVWLWVVEYLASFREIDSSVLHLLIEQAPAFPTDFAKNARERVALRCLEDLYASTSAAVAHGVPPSASEPKVVIDLEDSCEDVIQAILQETSMSDLKKGGPELLKWDIEPFIMHKRASMPKCVLEQLKETIVEGSDAIAACLAKFSGLVRGNEDGNRTIMEEDGRAEGPRRIDIQTEASGGNSIPQPLVTGQGAVGEDLHDSNMLSSEGDEVENNHGAASLGEQRCFVNHGAASLGEQGCFDGSDSQLADTERFQRNTLQSNMACDNSLMKDACKGTVQITEREDCPSGAESLRGVAVRITEKEDRPSGAESLRGVAVEEREHSSNADNVSGETSGQGIQAPSDDKLEDSRCETDFYTNKMSQGKSDMVQDMMVNGEANESEPRIPSDTALKECHQKVSRDEHNDGTGRDKEPKLGDALLVSGLTRNCNVEEENGHLSGEGTQRDNGGCSHKRVNDDTRESNSLSSQGLLSKDFLAAADLSGSNMCVKCSRNGQLLFCGTDGCPLAIHESCVGFTPSFDNRGQFCCPFCAYSIAISDYVKIKERRSVTLKQLSAFLHEGSKNPSVEHSERLFANDIRDFVEREDNQANNGKHVEEGNDCQFQNGMDRVQSAAMPTHCVSNQPTSKEEPSDVLCVSRGSGESQIKGTTLACPSVRAPERMQDLDLPEPPCFGDNLSSGNKDVVSEEQEQAEGATEKEVPEEIRAHNHKLVIPIRAVPVGGGPSDSKNDIAMSPNYSLILRKRKRKNAISSPRRQAVMWTAAEEKTLKEAVEKFSNDGKVPWKTVLEYGRSVFGDMRTTEDLRSKWKKMRKRRRN